jgi:excisionase family DNA binding protein
MPAKPVLRLAEPPVSPEAGRPSELAAPAAPVGALLLTPRQAAAALAVSERTLWGLTKAGKVPCVRLGRAVRYSPDDLRAFVLAQRCGGGG